MGKHMERYESSIRSEPVPNRNRANLPDTASLTAAHRGYEERWMRSAKNSERTTIVQPRW